jgi:serine/threonine-protein kinase
VDTESARPADQFGLANTTLAGRFWIERLVAEGGFGVVYRAQQAALARPVAIKVLKVATEHEAALRRTFEAEARAVARLKHPNIVEVHDFGVAEGPSGVLLHWMALEWLDGRTLEEFLDKLPRASPPGIPPARALELLRPVLQAIGFAHREGVVHRDLKPGNIFMVERHGSVVPKVLDFGIAQMLSASGEGEGQARAARDSTTAAGPAFSPDYAAPEQVSYGRTGPWTDVHALGLILSELCTGKRPYAGGEPEERFAAVVSERRPTPGAKGVDVGGWEPVLAKALARRPTDRYPDADALLAALNNGVETPASSPQQASRKSSRTLKQGLIALVAVLTMVAALLGWRAMERRSPIAADQGRIRIAVLPFEDLTGDGQQKYLSAGLTDGMISQLGRLLPQRLSVTARTSVSRYQNTAKSAKEIGQELGVDYLLSSTVRRDGSALHVGSHLVRVSDESEIWSETYQRQGGDIPVLQSEIGYAVAKAIRLKLGARELSALRNRHPVQPAAYQSYLRGKYQEARDPLGDRLRIAAFEEAIRLDPGFAAAHAGLAKALNNLIFNGLRDPAVEARCKSAALRALELDETLPDAHLAQAVVMLRQAWDWAGAERHFRRAFELDASDVDGLLDYSIFHITIGHFDEAIALRTRATEIDPLDPEGRWKLGMAYYFARRYDDAIRELKDSLAVDPKMPLVRAQLARAYVFKGMLPEAVVEARQLLEGVPRPQALAQAGYVLARAGRAQEARALLARISGPKGNANVAAPVLLAGVHVGLGEYDQAFTALEDAYQEHNFDLLFLRVSPLWDPIRDDPRFSALVRRVGIPALDHSSL